MTGQLEQTPKGWLSPKRLTGGVRGNRPGVSEDSDDSKVSFWLEQWLAQSWDSDICWHKWDKGEKKEWLERMARERKKLSIVQSSEVNGFLASISYRTDQWNPPSGVTLHDAALACLSSQIFPSRLRICVVIWNAAQACWWGLPWSVAVALLSFHTPCTFPIKIMVRDFPGGPVAKTVLPIQGDLCSIPGQGTGSHMSQLKVLHVATKTQYSQINKIMVILFLHTIS